MTKFGMTSKTPFNIEIEPNSLVVIGGRPGMGITTLGLSWTLNAEVSCKGHFISLHTTLAVLDSQFQGIEKLRKSYLEQPSTLPLVEHIVSVNNDSSPDFFVIDSLDYIGKEKPQFLNENKKYYKQLRHLKVLAQAMNKPIFLLTSIDQSIEECEPFFYHRKAHREKYADYILILYRWEYYQEPFITEDGTRLEENEALLIIGKSPKEQNTNYSVLKYDPANRLFKMK
jgi:replicative DNA helicase